MLDAFIWGLVQGLTEFLPISSSGHLVLVPAFLAEAGYDIGKPELAVSAVLHLGTLLAVLVYYRRDLADMTRFRTDPLQRRIIGVLALATIPALVGLPLKDTLDRFEDSPRAVATALLVTAAVLTVGSLLPVRKRLFKDAGPRDAVVVGLAQATALVPGISRSGTTITAALGMGFNRTEAARFSFLLGIPAIAGGGLLSLLDVGDTGVGTGALFIGFLTAAISGYAAIAVLVRVLTRVGFAPFALYCFVVGVLGIGLL